MKNKEFGYISCKPEGGVVPEEMKWPRRELSLLEGRWRDLINARDFHDMDSREFLEALEDLKQAVEEGDLR